MHAQKEYSKAMEMKSTYILYAPVTHTLTDFDGELRIKPQSSAEQLRAWPNFLRRSYL